LRPRHYSLALIQGQAYRLFGRWYFELVPSITFTQ
jgi:hypothetical protein